MFLFHLPFDNTHNFTLKLKQEENISREFRVALKQQPYNFTLQIDEDQISQRNSWHLPEMKLGVSVEALHGSPYIKRQTLLALDSSIAMEHGVADNLKMTMRVITNSSVATRQTIANGVPQSRIQYTLPQHEFTTDDTIVCSSLMRLEDGIALSMALEHTITNMRLESYYLLKEWDYMDPSGSTVDPSNQFRLFDFDMLTLDQMDIHR